MPVCEYYCETCKREVTRRLSISEHEKGRVACPKCGG
jgi:putative FmdB family regulatory protein